MQQNIHQGIKEESGLEGYCKAQLIPPFSLNLSGTAAAQTNTKVDGKSLKVDLFVCCGCNFSVLLVSITRNAFFDYRQETLQHTALGLSP